MAFRSLQAVMKAVLTSMLFLHACLAKNIVTRNCFRDAQSVSLVADCKAPSCSNGVLVLGF